MPNLSVSHLPPAPPWIVVLADDDQDIHTITRMVLNEFTFEGRGLRLLNAYSAAETIALLTEHPDAAVVLLDVVMESDHAGLEAIHQIREVMGNKKVRIVIRTGQAGMAPEREVIRRYDIHDYVLKTDLKSARLETVLFSCLRSFRDIMAIEASKLGLEKIIDASAALFQLQSVSKFAEGALEQLSALLHVQHGALLAGDKLPEAERADPGALAAAGSRTDQLSVVAATGRFGGTVGEPLFAILPPDASADVNAHLANRLTPPSADRFISVYRGSATSKVLLVEGRRSNDAIDEKLLNLFSRNVGIGFENLQLKESLEETQREIAYRLGGAVEFRSKETANHIRRVAEMSAMIGRCWGLSEREAEVLKYASPLHDVGKIGIPDHILNKPGKHDPDEWEIMKTHTQLGYDLVYNPDLEILRVGGIIALEHHERWDGGGYPFGKRGEEIGVHGRVVAAIDVFDALGSRRCYKEAWPIDRILDLLIKERGHHFDPAIVDLMIERVDDLNAIRAALPDGP